MVRTTLLLIEDVHKDPIPKCNKRRRKTHFIFLDLGAIPEILLLSSLCAHSC